MASFFIPYCQALALALAHGRARRTLRSYRACCLPLRELRDTLQEPAPAYTLFPLKRLSVPPEGSCPGELQKCSTSERITVTKSLRFLLIPFKDPITTCAVLNPIQCLRCRIHLIVILPLGENGQLVQILREPFRLGRNINEAVFDLARDRVHPHYFFHENHPTGRVEQAGTSKLRPSSLPTGGPPTCGMCPSAEPLRRVLRQRSLSPGGFAVDPAIGIYAAVSEANQRAAAKVAGAKTETDGTRSTTELNANDDRGK